MSRYRMIVIDTFFLNEIDIFIFSSLLAPVWIDLIHEFDRSLIKLKYLYLRNIFSELRFILKNRFLLCSIRCSAECIREQSHPVSTVFRIGTSAHKHGTFPSPRICSLYLSVETRRMQPLNGRFPSGAAGFRLFGSPRAPPSNTFLSGGKKLPVRD